MAFLDNINITDILWVLVLISFLIPLIQKRMLLIKRQVIMRSIETKRNSRVISMIHRQEVMSFFGFPFARYIDIEDSEAVLRAIRMTPPEMQIDLVLHTPGGLVLAAEQIACALKRHKGNVTVFIPHYAMSGGSLIAMAADEIVMDPNAVLGPMEVYELMELYQQSGMRRPSVEFIPTPYMPHALPGKGK